MILFLCPSVKEWVFCDVILIMGVKACIFGGEFFLLKIILSNDTFVLSVFKVKLGHPWRHVRRSKN